MHLSHTSERIDRYQNGSNVGIDFTAGPPLLKVIIDAFIADSGKQGHIRYADLLLLKPFLPIGLSQIVI
jgi:hypothetical protein